MNLRLLALAASIVFALLLTLNSCADKQVTTPRLLVFSKTEGFRHESIEAGQAALQKMAQENNWRIDITENDSAFYEDNLKQYHAVIFLNTTGDILNAEQQNNFERFIQAGGGFVGIHSATDTEYDWPWYNQLVGAYFASHPAIQEAEYHTVDHEHPATDSLPDSFRRTDEFYNFRNISSDIKVLVRIDESTYEGGTNGADHPASWYQEFDGGRMFYTAMGHTNESYSEPLFLTHLRGGIRYALGGDEPKALDYNQARTQRMPEENRFNKVVLAQGLNEPIELAILPSGNVLFIERRGAVNIYNQRTRQITMIDSIAVSTKYNPDKNGEQRNAEDGLLGLALDPNFAENNFIYLYYSPAGDDPKNILTRYELRDEKLVHESMKVMLEVPVQRDECCHTGGSITFDAQGNLFLSTGDNSNPFANGFAPLDERPGRSPWDARKSSANPNDLRGKILRIHPEADGSYTIPEGNLFPVGTEGTRPEIYVMGNRNPYRISVDQKTGYLYWGEVGPDANRDSVPFGPRGYDEVNQARKAGNFGWPLFVGNNYAYVDYKYAANKSTGQAFDPARPINDSPNNTGRQDLPPAQPAFIWYPYDQSEEFPLVGSGGRNAMAGPVYYAEDFKDAPRAFPAYYDGKLIIYDWIRGWIMAVTMNEAGDFVSMEPFMGSYKFSNPIDMTFSPEGDLYILEYGTGWFKANEDARLVRIEYTAGNRKPQVMVSADKTQGAAPLSVNFTSAGTIDYDKDKLTYQWTIFSPEGEHLAKPTTPTAAYTFEQAGAYQVKLEVTDAQGEKASEVMIVQVGNEPPQLDVAIQPGNTTFFFPGQAFQYQVSVEDKEDGALSSGTIDAEQVAFTVDYLAEGYDKAIIALGHRSADEGAVLSVGKRLIDNSDCKSCHLLDKKSIGPTYVDVARKYRDDPKAMTYLATKIQEGGSGVWGETAMPAHPLISDDDARQMADYILGLGRKPANSLPIKGSYTTTPKGQRQDGVYILRAAYTDQGANGIPGITAEKVLVLRSANLTAAQADTMVHAQKITANNMDIVLLSKHGGYVAFRQLDLTAIETVKMALGAAADYGMQGGSVEVRLDAPDGPLLGATPVIQPTKGTPSPQFATVNLQPTTGKHDVYFVAVNAQAPPDKMLLSFTNLQFKPGTPRKS